MTLIKKNIIILLEKLVIDIKIKKIKKITFIFSSVIAWIIFAAILISLLFSLVVFYFSYNSSSISFLDYTVYLNSATNMHPKIKTDEVIVVKKVDYKNIKVADVVVFNTKNIENEKVVAIKRVVSKPGKDSFIIMSDAVSDLEQIEYPQVIGIYVCSIPYSSFVASFFENKSDVLSFLVIYFSSILLLITISVLAFVFVNRQKVIKQDKQEKLTELDLEKLIEVDEEALTQNKDCVEESEQK